MFCIISVKIKRLSETTAEFLEDNKAELTLVVSSAGPSAISLPSYGLELEMNLHEVRSFTITVERAYWHFHI